MKKFKHKKLILTIFIIIAICFCVEIVISSFSNIALKLSGAEETTISLSTAEIIDAKNLNTEDGNISLKSGVLMFENINREIENICIESSSNNGKYVDVEISFTDDNFAFEDGYNYNNAKFLMFAGENEKNYFTFSSFGEVKGLKINILDASVPITISSIKLNTYKPFHISFFRLAVLILTAVIIKFKLWKIEYSLKNSVCVAISALMLCASVIAILSLMNISNADVNLLDEYPSPNISSEDQYRQLFEAFSNGKLSLDIDYDTTKLDALINPYDRSERNASSLHGDFWDRAYYKGNFYSYFGVTPIITVYFPVFFATGKAPSTLLASGILCIYAIIFMSLLYNLIISKFCKGASLVLVILGHISVIFGSLIFAISAESMFYYMATVSGVAWLAAFFYFILKAYFEENFKKRIIFLILTGFSVVLLVSSRPTLVLYCLSAIVPAAFILSNRREKFKNKVLYIVSIGTPILVGAILLMLYNYKRFENPFEFGFNYQLTVSMAKANNITLSMLPATIYHYFLQQPRFSSSFPYLEIKSYALESYSRYNYAARTMGLMNYPLTWALPLAPLAFDKKEKFRNFFFGTIGVTALLIAFINMCSAGSHYRYTVDVLFPLLFVSIAAVFTLLESLKKISAKYNFAYVLTVTVMSATIVLGYLMIFANESRKFIKDYPILVEFLRSL